MNTITKNNYEAYLLDYVEGNLSPEGIAELMLFLENNPDLKDELDDFELVELVPPVVNLVDKESLKKRGDLINLNNYEEFLIAEIEDQNDPKTSEELQLFLKKNRDKQKEYGLYQKTILKTPAIIFDDKKSLKKKEGKVIPMYWWYASAAAVVLIFFLFKGLQSNEKKNNLPLAEEKEQVVPQHQEETPIKENNITDKNLADLHVVKNEVEESAPIKDKVKKPKSVPLEKVQPAPKNEIALQPKDEALDSAFIKDYEEPFQEEVEYADNVKIIYEEDEDQVANVVPTKGHKTKFDVVKAVINQQVKKKFLQKGDDELGVETYAINLGILGFGKNKNKK